MKAKRPWPYRIEETAERPDLFLIYSDDVTQLPLKEGPDGYPMPPQERRIYQYDCRGMRGLGVCSCRSFLARVYKERKRVAIYEAENDFEGLSVTELRLAQSVAGGTCKHETMIMDYKESAEFVEQHLREILDREDKPLAASVIRLMMNAVAEIHSHCHIQSCSPWDPNWVRVAVEILMTSLRDQCTGRPPDWLLKNQKTIKHHTEKAAFELTARLSERGGEFEKAIDCYLNFATTRSGASFGTTLGLLEWFFDNDGSALAPHIRAFIRHTADLPVVPDELASLSRLERFEIVETLSRMGDDGKSFIQVVNNQACYAIPS